MIVVLLGIPGQFLGCSGMWMINVAQSSSGKVQGVGGEDSSEIPTIHIRFYIPIAECGTLDSSPQRRGHSPAGRRRSRLAKGHPGLWLQLSPWWRTTDSSHPAAAQL